MDLTYYFKRETNPNDKKIVDHNKRKDTRAQFTQMIKNFLKDSVIDMTDFNRLVEFTKSGGPIIKIHLYCQLMNKIMRSPSPDLPGDTKDRFLFINKELFSHLYDCFNNSTLGTDESSINMNMIKEMMIDTNKDTINFTNDQLNAIKNLIAFLCNNEQTTYGLYGYAGTGKTTLITKLVMFLLIKKYIRSIAFVAPTNKAVNVIKSKFRNDIKMIVKEESLSLLEQLNTLETHGFTVHFLTIHKLLNYKNDFDVEGERIFVKGNKSNISLYDLVIIDECSMVSQQITIHISEAVDAIIRSGGKDKTDMKAPKILFVGDPAQLPPVNEAVSIIFSKDKGDFKFETYKKLMGGSEIENQKEFSKEVEADYLKRYNLFVNKIINQGSSTLEQVVRSNDDRVVGLCNEIRGWVLDRIKQPRIGKYTGEKVKLYNYTKGPKTETEWFKTCLRYFQGTDCTSNIILAWTNRQCETYNKRLRQLLFKKEQLNQFERGDILVLNDFYNIKESSVEDKKTKQKRFYTSEQIKVVEVDETMKGIMEFSETLSAKVKKIENAAFAEDKFRKTVKAINKGTVRKYDVWKLQVQKTIDSSIKDIVPDSYQLFVIKDSSKEQLTKDRDFVAEKIKELRKTYAIFMKDKLDTLDREIIRPLWRDWNVKLFEPFAIANISYCLTVHRVQASTYYNVFVDASDILNNPNQVEAKRCIYTAITRTSNEVHILI